MAGYSIGQVEELTGVKPHVLRYWEEIIPGISPEKDFGGRRIYSKKDIEIINRLNFLVNEKKFTIEGARDQLITEAQIISESNELCKIKSTLNEIRDELMTALTTVKRFRSKK